MYRHRPAEHSKRERKARHLNVGGNTTNMDSGGHRKDGLGWENQREREEREGLKLHQQSVCMRGDRPTLHLTPERFRMPRTMGLDVGTVPSEESL